MFKINILFKIYCCLLEELFYDSKKMEESAYFKEVFNLI